MKETKRKFYKKICKWKKQILCVGAGIFLGIAAWLAQGMDPVIEAGNVIQRPDGKLFDLSSDRGKREEKLSL